MGLTMLFISHDLAVVEFMCDRVIVLYLGRIMEIAPSERLYAAPRHPYTRALLSAIPSPDPDAPRNLPILAGDIPSRPTRAEEHTSELHAPMRHPQAGLA